MINMRIALFERTKHKHEQRSFRFLAERHNALANGTLPKRFVGETTGHLVCHIAVFSVVTQCSSPQGGALRDDTKNGCVADYRSPARERLFPSSHLPPRAYVYCCFSCGLYWNTQREPLPSRKGERFNTEIFFYHRKKIHWLTFHKRSALTKG